jgi:hypothetical protein
VAEYTFGNVPHPAFQDRPIVKAENFGQNNLGQRTVKGVVWHRMIGTLWGTDAYFRMENVAALTDYGIGVEAQDGANNDGLILRWNNPLGVQSGWASGPVSGAYGDGLAFVNKYGINAVNRDQASIEISGKTYDVPLSEKSRNVIAALTAYWADQYKIPHDKFPISDQDGFSFVRWHQEFTIGTGKVCPGKVVMDETNDLIERTRAVLKQYQEGVTTPVPSTTYPTGMDKGVAEHLFGTEFNVNGPISKRWLDRGKATGLWPKYLGKQTFDDRTYYTFADGWTLWKGATGGIKELK